LKEVDGHALSLMKKEDFKDIEVSLPNALKIIDLVSNLQISNEKREKITH